jgi:hypothetical protein
VSTEQKRKRARLDPTIESEESYLTKIEVKVKIPDELKPWLVDDWDLVTRQNQLVSLPCKHTVDSILDDYLRLKLTKPNHPNKDTIIEVNNGIREYFNVMLGTQLLYKFERPQYGQVQYFVTLSGTVFYLKLFSWFQFSVHSDILQLSVLHRNMVTIVNFQNQLFHRGQIAPLFIKCV